MLRTATYEESLSLSLDLVAVGLVLRLELEVWVGRSQEHLTVTKSAKSRMHKR